MLDLAAVVLGPDGNGDLTECNQSQSKRSLTSQTCGLVVGSVLLTASFLKMSEAILLLVHFSALLIQHQGLLFVTASLSLALLEGLLAFMLVLNKGGRRLFCVSGILFSLFLAFNISKLTSGATHCDCMGTVGFPIGLMIALDLSLALACLIGYCNESHTILKKSAFRYSCLGVALMGALFGLRESTGIASSFGGAPVVGALFGGEDGDAATGLRRGNLASHLEAGVL